MFTPADVTIVTRSFVIRSPDVSVAAFLCCIRLFLCDLHRGPSLVAEPDVPMITFTFFPGAFAEVMLVTFPYDTEWSPVLSAPLQANQQIGQAAEDFRREEKHPHSPVGDPVVTIEKI
jgi:hypothetical protein